MSMLRKVEGLSPFEELVRDEVVAHFTRRAHPPNPVKLQLAVRSSLRHRGAEGTCLKTIVGFLKETKVFPIPEYMGTEAEVFLAQRIHAMTRGDHYIVTSPGAQAAAAAAAAAAPAPAAPAPAAPATPAAAAAAAAAATTTVATTASAAAAAAAAAASPPVYDDAGSDVQYTGVWGVNKRIRVVNVKDIFLTPTGLNLVWAALPSEDGDLFREVNECVKQKFRDLLPALEAETKSARELSEINEDQIGTEIALLKHSGCYDEKGAIGWVGQCSQRLLRAMVPGYEHEKLSRAVRDAIPAGPLRPSGEQVVVNRFLKRTFKVSYLYAHERVLTSLGATVGQPKRACRRDEDGAEMEEEEEEEEEEEGAQGSDASSDDYHPGPVRPPNRQRINAGVKAAIATFEKRHREDYPELYAQHDKKAVARMVFEHPRITLRHRLAELRDHRGTQAAVLL